MSGNDILEHLVLESGQVLIIRVSERLSQANAAEMIERTRSANIPNPVILIDSAVGVGISARQPDECVHCGERVRRTDEELDGYSADEFPWTHALGEENGTPYCDLDLTATPAGGSTP